LGDYQLVEEQDTQGLPRYTLMVSPTLGPLRDDHLRTVFLDELGRLRRAYGFMVEQWAQSGQPTIVRRGPAYSERGQLQLGRTVMVRESSPGWTSSSSGH